MICTGNCWPRWTTERASWPTRRWEVRYEHIIAHGTRYEISDLPFQNMLPNMVVVGLVICMAFKGTIDQYPYSFQQFKLTSIKQVTNLYNWWGTTAAKTLEATDNFYKPRNVCVRVEETWWEQRIGGTEEIAPCSYLRLMRPTDVLTVRCWIPSWAESCDWSVDLVADRRLSQPDGHRLWWIRESLRDQQ